MQTQTDRLSSTFSALADPTRRAILARLSSGEASVTDLAKPMKMTMPAVTKHLKVLQKAGLIRQERRAQWRPCYLVASPLKEASDWVEQYRKFWEQSFDRLEAYLKVLQAQGSDPIEEKPIKSRAKKNDKRK
jgi:DNA-binding transcriptional ArsR family regulator